MVTMIVFARSADMSHDTKKWNLTYDLKYESSSKNKKEEVVNFTRHTLNRNVQKKSTRAR